MTLPVMGMERITASADKKTGQAVPSTQSLLLSRLGLASHTPNRGTRVASDPGARLVVVPGDDFYLAASAIIPILAVAKAVERRLTMRPESPEAEAMLRISMKGGRIGVVLWEVAQVTLFMWAEFICLRRMETGTLWIGGTTVVWIALAYGAANLALLRLAEYVEESDVAALFRWLHRKGIIPVVAVGETGDASAED